MQERTLREYLQDLGMSEKAIEVFLMSVKASAGRAKDMLREISKSEAASPAAMLGMALGMVEAGSWAVARMCQKWAEGNIQDEKGFWDRLAPLLMVAIFVGTGRDVSEVVGNVMSIQSGSKKATIDPSILN